MRFAMGLDPDVLGFAHFLEHSGDAIDLLYGLTLESTHSRPKLKFFDKPCGVCTIPRLASHVHLGAPHAATPVYLCPTCQGMDLDGY